LNLYSSPDARIVWAQVTSSANEHAAYIKVDHPEYFREGDIILVPRNGEWMLVKEVLRGGLGVGRGWGGRKAFPLVDRDDLQRIGSFVEEPEWVTTSPIVPFAEGDRIYVAERDEFYRVKEVFGRYIRVDKED
jgi:hypothetical protein